MVKWLFLRLVLASGGPVCFFFCNLKPLFKRTRVISKRLRDKILTNFWIHVAALARGFSDRNFERGEGPGDEVVMKSLCTRAP